MARLWRRLNDEADKSLSSADEDDLRQAAELVRNVYERSRGRTMSIEDKAVQLEDRDMKKAA
jgi:hypothetical protein